MIDIHCHILPGVDDGAQTVQQALMMAAIAVDDGVTAVVATPHLNYRNGFEESDIIDISQSAREFKAELEKAKIPLKIFVAAEVLCLEIDEKTKISAFPFIGKSRYALVEFLFDASEGEIMSKIALLQNSGVQPIIAHPERFFAVQRNKSFLQKLVDGGCLLQFNKGSAFGQFGTKAKRIAQYMLKNRLAHVLACDAHDTVSRTNRLSSAASELAKHYDKHYIELLTNENPRKIINNVRPEDIIAKTKEI